MSPSVGRAERELAEFGFLGEHPRPEVLVAVAADFCHRLDDEFAGLGVPLLHPFGQEKPGVIVADDYEGFDHDWCQLWVFVRGVHDRQQQNGERPGAQVLHR